MALGSRPVAAVVNFGWPLMINALLMLGIFEGDRMLIGSSERLFPGRGYSLTDLGVYSATFALTMTPTLFTANITSSLFLPLLSRVQSDAEQFRRRYVACCQAVCLAAALFAILFVTAGGMLVTTIYGSKYAGAAEIIGWLGAMWALRIVRVAPTLAAMALGDTKNTMIANSVRMMALVGMLISAATGAGLVWIPISGFAGELLALSVSVWRLAVHSGVSAQACLKPAFIATVGVVLSAILAPGAGAGMGFTVGLWLGCTVLMTVAMLTLFEGFRDDLVGLLSKARGGALAET